MAKEGQPIEQNGSKIPTDVNNVLYQKTPWGVLCNTINPEDVLSETATPTSDNFSNVWEPKVVERSETPSYNGFNIAAEDLTGVGEDIILGG